MELLTGKCKEDFEDWYVRGFHNDGGYHDYMKRSFYSKIFSMQYGVLVDFFASVDIHIDVLKVYKCLEYRYIIEKDYSHTIEGDCSTRPEARTEAIKKANEIYNKKQLNNIEVEYKEIIK